MFKGISPLIAAVMLLAFAMAVGGIFSEWSGELVRSSTSDTSESQSEVIDCSGKTIEVATIETGSSNDWVNATLRADGGSLGEIRVTVFPSRLQDTIYLNEAGGINTTSIKVSGPQEYIEASSIECAVTTEENIEY